MTTVLRVCCMRRRSWACVSLRTWLSAVGVALVLLPMTASRLVFSLAGLVVLVVGVVMLLDRLRNRRRLEASSDPNIIDAL